MNTHRAKYAVRQHPRPLFRPNDELSRDSVNDLLRAGVVFVLLGLFALVMPILTTRHHTARSLVFWQSMYGTRAQDSESDSDTIPSVATEGFILVGCVLVGVCSSLKG